MSEHICIRPTEQQYSGLTNTIVFSIMFMHSLQSTPNKTIAS